MIQFEDKFVHFRWDDSLKGKKCFLADDMSELRLAFENELYDVVTDFHCEGYPFKTAESYYMFAYYDPNYELKKAYNEGKQIQYKSAIGKWVDCSPSWRDGTEYRIKPAGLHWTDLKVGDVIQNGNLTAMVTAIDSDADDDCHIHAGDVWMNDKDIEYWRKV